MSETIPIRFFEKFNIHNGRGKVVERWTVINIRTEQKKKYMDVQIEDLGVIP